MTGATLTYQLEGGDTGGALPTNVAQVLANPTASGGGSKGVGLRDLATGNYVFTAKRSGSGGGLQAGSFNLSGLVGDGKLYRFDYFDYNNGGWGWVDLDNVVIPGSFVLLSDNQLIKQGDGHPDAAVGCQHVQRPDHDQRRHADRPGRRRWAHGGGNHHQHRRDAATYAAPTAPPSP